MSPVGFTADEEAWVRQLMADLQCRDAGAYMREMASRDPGAHRLLVEAILRVDGGGSCGWTT